MVVVHIHLGNLYFLGMPDYLDIVLVNKQDIALHQLYTYNIQLGLDNNIEKYILLHYLADLYLHYHNHFGKYMNIVDFLMYNFGILSAYLLNYIFQYNHIHNLNNIGLLHFQ